MYIENWGFFFFCRIERRDKRGPGILLDEKAKKKTPPPSESKRGYESIFVCACVRGFFFFNDVYIVLPSDFCPSHRPLLYRYYNKTVVDDFFFFLSSSKYYIIFTYNIYTYTHKTLLCGSGTLPGSVSVSPANSKIFPLCIILLIYYYFVLERIQRGSTGSGLPLIPPPKSYTLFNIPIQYIVTYTSTYTHNTNVKNKYL